MHATCVATYDLPVPNPYVCIALTNVCCRAGGTAFCGLEPSLGVCLLVARSYAFGVYTHICCHRWAERRRQDNNITSHHIANARSRHICHDRRRVYDRDLTAPPLHAYTALLCAAGFAHLPRHDTPRAALHCAPCCFPEHLQCNLGSAWLANSGLCEFCCCNCSAASVSTCQPHPGYIQWSCSSKVQPHLLMMISPVRPFLLGSLVYAKCLWVPDNCNASDSRQQTLSSCSQRIIQLLRDLGACCGPAACGFQLLLGRRQWVPIGLLCQFVNHIIPKLHVYTDIISRRSDCC
jgi:hypothetical protein